VGCDSFKRFWLPITQLRLQCVCVQRLLARPVIMSSCLFPRFPGLQVVRPAGAAKPRLLTTSGQRVPIYQYDLMGGDAIVHTIRGLLISGNQTFAAPAPAPMM
jgi:hypothetical protein